MSRVDPLGLSDYYAGLGAQLASPTGGGSISIGLVFDSADIYSSGIYLTTNYTAGAHAAFGVQAGYADRDIEGDSYNVDNNMIPFSPAITFDDQGVNGLEGSWGPGKGGSVSSGRTNTLSLRNLGFGRPRIKSDPAIAVDGEFVCVGQHCVAEQDPEHEEQTATPTPSAGGGGREGGGAHGTGGGGTIIGAGCYGNCGGKGPGTVNLGPTTTVRKN